MEFVIVMQVGARVFRKRNKVPSYSQYDLDADSDPKIQPPDMTGKPIPADLTGILEMLPKWITWPDYEKVGHPAVQLP